MTTEKDDSEEICYDKSLKIVADKWNSVDLSKPPPSINLSEATERAKAYKERLLKGECKEELLFMENAVDHRYERGFVKYTEADAEEFGYEPAKPSEKVLAARKYTEFVKSKADYDPEELEKDRQKLEEIIIWGNGSPSENLVHSWSLLRTREKFNGRN